MTHNLSEAAPDALHMRGIFLSVEERLNFLAIQMRDDISSGVIEEHMLSN